MPRTPAFGEMYRIGIGHDTHRLVAGRPLRLGGVEIPYDLGAEGHSDADALTHAITDAILGALCEGDLGLHFPDTDEKWRDADSLDLLSRVVWLAKERGWRVGNIDSNILLERPKLRGHILHMRDRLAAIAGIDQKCISIKAKTGEGLGEIGRGEAVTAQAVVLLERI